ncbi:MAG TPA: hypothetical protein VHW23_46735 [Kofleriaceae bacterium]|nr:hypothetical protein [Kofleriaceae bacterium]
MITQRGLVDQLVRRAPAAWSVVERIADLGFAADRPARQRRDRRTRLTVIVHQDLPRGRGTARLDVDPFDGSPADLVDRAIALALAAVGPAWTSAPPAAPARVDLVDPSLVEPDLVAVAAGALARLRRPDRLTVAAAVEVLREKVTVISGSGLHATWLATALAGDALLATADHSLTVSRRARRLDDLDLDAALADAAADLALLADAGPPVPGPCTVWLGPDALLPAPDHFRGDDGSLGLSGDLGSDLRLVATADDTAAAHHHGLWTLFAQQADSAVERRGLTRYRLHADLAPGASQLPEPLSITSNGALDFATLSAPITDDAVAIRSFPLVDRGVAVGLGLSPREAALRATDPNGGVRNLVVAPGTWFPAPSPTTRTLEVRRLHAVTIDAYTGDATLDIALALDHHPGRPAPTPFTGGTLRLDLLAGLARARRSSQLLRRGAYHGPAALLIDDLELIA